MKRFSFRAAKISILYAISGLVLALGILVLMGATRMLSKTDILSPVILGSVGYLLFAFISSGLVGAECENKSKSMAIISGIVIAILSLEVGTILGTLPELQSDDEFDPFSWLIKPLFWINFIGFIPALVIGALFGWHLTRSISRSRGD